MTSNLNLSRATIVAILAASISVGIAPQSNQSNQSVTVQAIKMNQSHGPNHYFLQDRQGGFQMTSAHEDAGGRPTGNHLERTLRMRLMRQAGLGNCLFHSLAFAVNNLLPADAIKEEETRLNSGSSYRSQFGPNKTDHVLMRNAIVNVESDANLFNPKAWTEVFFGANGNAGEITTSEQHINHMTRTGSWGENPEIYAFTRLHQDVRVRVYNEKSSDVWVFGSSVRPYEINLINEGNEHWEVLVPENQWGRFQWSRNRSGNHVGTGWSAANNRSSAANNQNQIQSSARPHSSASASRGSSRPRRTRRNNSPNRRNNVARRNNTSRVNSRRNNVARVAAVARSNNVNSSGASSTSQEVQVRGPRASRCGVFSRLWNRCISWFRSSSSPSQPASQPQPAVVRRSIPSKPVQKPTRNNSSNLQSESDSLFYTRTPQDNRAFFIATRGLAYPSGFARKQVGTEGNGFNPSESSDSSDGKTLYRSLAAALINQALVQMGSKRIGFTVRMRAAGNERHWRRIANVGANKAIKTPFGLASGNDSDMASHDPNNLPPTLAKNLKAVSNNSSAFTTNQLRTIAQAVLQNRATKSELVELAIPMVRRNIMRAMAKGNAAFSPQQWQEAVGTCTTPVQDRDAQTGIPLVDTDYDSTGIPVSSEKVMISISNPQQYRAYKQKPRVEGGAAEIAAFTQLLGGAVRVRVYKQIQSSERRFTMDTYGDKSNERSRYGDKPQHTISLLATEDEAGDERYDFLTPIVEGY